MSERMLPPYLRWINGSVYLKLTDAAGSAKFSIEDSAGTEVWKIDSDGHHQDVTLYEPLPLSIGGGTANIELWNGTGSINLDADSESFFVAVGVPPRWNGSSNITVRLFIGNEIAEDDGDDIDIYLRVRAYSDGDTASDAGQSCHAELNLTGGDEAINQINEVTATIVYNHGTYPIAAGDDLAVYGYVSLGAGGQCTGPLHIVGWRLEYTADRLGA